MSKTIEGVPDSITPADHEALHFAFTRRGREEQLTLLRDLGFDPERIAPHQTWQWSSGGLRVHVIEPDGLTVDGEVAAFIDGWNVATHQVFIPVRPKVEG